MRARGLRVAVAVLATQTLGGLNGVRDLSAETTAHEVGGAASYSFTTRLRQSVVATDATKVWIRFPLPRTAGDQNFSQSASWSMSYSTPPDEEESYTDYWTIARWFFDPPVDVTISAEIAITGSATASFPSFADENFTWYPDNANYMASTDNAQVTQATIDEAQDIYVFSASYPPAGRMGDLEAIASWAVQIAYDNTEGTPQDGASVISAKRGDCEGYANAMCSLCKSMGIPSGVVSTVSYAGTIDLGCGSVTAPSIELHAIAVTWDGVNGEWIVADPQYSGTAIAAAATHLALGPDVDYVFPAAAADYVSGGGATVTRTIPQNSRSGGSGATCINDRSTCGYFACTGDIVTRQNLGEPTRISELGRRWRLPTVIAGTLWLPGDAPPLRVFDAAGRLIGKCDPPCELDLASGRYLLKPAYGRVQKLSVIR